MKLTFKTILSSVKGLQELQELKFPPKISLDIYKMAKELDRELVAYRDLKDKIFKHYQIPENENGYDLSKVPSDKIDKLLGELEHLGDAEVTINDYSVDINVFERFNLPITPAMLGQLEWFIKDSTEPVPEEKPLKGKAAKVENN